MVGQAIPERDITKPVGRKQIKFIKDLLTQGVPAFVAKVKAMTEQQRHNIRAATRELLKSGELGDLAARAEAALKALRGLEDTTTIIPNEEIANDFEEASAGIKRGDVRAVHPERQTLVQRAAVKLAREFGKNVIYLERKDGSDLGFEGVSLRNKYPQYIFLDAKSGHDPRFLVGHELAHHLEKTNPQGFAKLLSDLRPFINKVEWGEFYSRLKREGLSDDAIREELVANLVGDSLYRSLDKNHPPLHSARFSTDLAASDKLISSFLNGKDEKVGADNTAKNNAQQAGTTPLTDAQKAEVKAELLKTLGPKIKVAFEKIFGPIIEDKNGVRTIGPDGKPLREEWSGDQVDGLIRISITALDPLGTSRHEAMHHSHRHHSTMRQTELRKR